MVLHLLATFFLGLASLDSVDVAMVDYIQRVLPEQSTIVELGSGPRTDLLAQYYQMHSVEDDLQYINEWESNYLYAPLIDGWYDVASIERYLPEQVDLLLIDGPREEGLKKEIFNHLDFVHKDVPLVFKGFDQDDLLEYAATLGRSLQFFEGFSVALPREKDESIQ